MENTSREVFADVLICVSGFSSRCLDCITFAPQRLHWRGSQLLANMIKLIRNVKIGGSLGLWDLSLDGYGPGEE